VGGRQPVSRPAPGLARPGKDWMTTRRFQALRDMQFTRKRAVEPPLACVDGPQLLATPAPTQRYFFKRTKWTDRGAGCVAAGSRRRGVAAGFLLVSQEPLRELPARSIVPVDHISDFVAPPATSSRSQVQSSFRVLSSDPNPPGAALPGLSHPLIAAAAPCRRRTNPPVGVRLFPPRPNLAHLAVSPPAIQNSNPLKPAWCDYLTQPLDSTLPPPHKPCFGAR